MSERAPQQLAQQWVAPILGETGMMGVAFGYDRIVKKWMPEQVDELEATGRLMVELASKLRQVREEVPKDDMDTSLGQLDRTR